MPVARPLARCALHLDRMSLTKVRHSATLIQQAAKQVSISREGRFPFKLQIRSRLQPDFASFFTQSWPSAGIRLAVVGIPSGVLDRLASPTAFDSGAAPPSFQALVEPEVIRALARW